MRLARLFIFLFGLGIVAQPALAQDDDDFLLDEDPEEDEDVGVPVPIDRIEEKPGILLRGRIMPHRFLTERIESLPSAMLLLTSSRLNCRSPASVVGARADEDAMMLSCAGVTVRRIRCSATSVPCNM